MSNHRVVGKRLQRLDAVGKVTGRHVYGADFSLPGMLEGRLLRSTEPSARIARLDTSAALAVPGVRAVVTARDVPAERFGSFIKDIEVFAADTVRYVGQPVAAVAATTREAADEALRRIAVEYVARPAVFEIDDALADGAPLVHERWADYEAAAMLCRDGNVANRARLAVGDVDAAFAGAAHVFEDRFETAPVHPGFTEPRAAVAAWQSRDQLTVWTNTQLPFEQQARLAEIFRIAASRIRVIVCAVGGGFGGKLRLGVEHYAAVLARKARRPVRMMLSCEEELATGFARQPTAVELTTAVDGDGRIVARRGRARVDCGAMSGSGPGVAAGCILMLCGPYSIANLDIEALAVYTNKPPTGSFRAPPGPQGNFPVESQMDMIAARLGLDPLEFRLRNLVGDGDTAATGQTLGPVSLATCLTKAAEAIGWHDRPAQPGRGKGIACGWWLMSGGSSGVYLKLSGDGQVVLSTGCAELGTGSTTGAAQVLAEALGVELDDIAIVSADTHATPYDYGAQGSRSMAMVANACLTAAEDLKRQIVAVAAGHLGVPEDGLEVRDRQVAGAGRSLSLAEVAMLSQTAGGGLIAHGTYIAPRTPYDAQRMTGMVLPVLDSPTYHAHAADVTVDPDTGEVTVNKYVVAQDVGFAINPTYVEGQIEGGVAQGIGQALLEELAYRDGRVRNPNLTDYKMLTAVDAPAVQSILIEEPGPVGPHGAKGVGEPPVIEPPATLANAVADACGVRVTQLPITAEKIALSLRSRPR